jgi:hypothetical protein
LGRLEALAAPSRPDDSGDAPLTGEDLIGDLDPGWLDWRENQEER